MVMLTKCGNTWTVLTGLLFVYFEVVAGQVEGDVRLRDSGNYYSGRVEIYHAGRWGTVCDDDWDINDAIVTCRQLGFNSAITAYQSTYYGQGTGYIWLDNVECSGFEIRLEYCNSNGWNIHDCIHAEDAGVECSNHDFGLTTPSWWPVIEGDVRLVGGFSQFEGRVEVYYNGEWNTVCDDSWDSTDASVVCRQLGYEGSAEALGDAYFGAGYGDILLANVACNGWESALLQCPSNSLYIHNCDHTEDAGVRCRTEVSEEENGSVRLIGGTMISEGRVEIFYDEWGTICDDRWSREDAEVICRQLGYTGVDLFYNRAYFGRGIGPIMENMNCNGDELFWNQCPYVRWNTNYCTHDEDAGVKCSTDVSGVVRLRDGFSERSGRVEIYNDGQWGTICDDYWTLEDAIVICRQLGYRDVNSYYSEAHFGEGSGPIMGNLGCSGDEWSWQDCTYSNWRTISCSHAEDAAVVCSMSGDTIYGGTVRLVGGNGDQSGRVEIDHFGEWGTVCDDGWGMEEANVVCRQLGYPAALNYECNAYFGQGYGPIMLDEVNCDGSEHDLADCGHSGWYNHNCGHSEDVGVMCRTPVTYYPRLVDGYTWYEGRVEVWDGRRWEKVCDEDFYTYEATTVCKQLGFSDYETTFDGDNFGSGNEPPSDVRFDCDFYANELANCYVYPATIGSYCGSVALRCKQDSSDSMNGGAIAGIVIASVCVFVFISVGLLVSYQTSNRNRRRSSQPRNIAVISGTDNLTGPSATQPNQNNFAAPPTYNGVMNNPAYLSPHVEPFPMPQAGMQPYPPQPNQGQLNTSQPEVNDPSSKPEFVYPYPLDTSPSPMQPPPYPVQPSMIQPSNHPPVSTQPQL